MSFEISCFLEDLKLAEVSPNFKKDDDLDKENYRPGSVLSHDVHIWNVEGHIGRRRLCLCSVYGLIKGFWHSNCYLLIAKLGTYGVERESLSFMKSYLSSRQ